MLCQRREDSVNAALVKFVPALLPPLVGQVRAGAVDGPGGLKQVSLGVEDIDNLYGIGEQLCAHVPDPGGAVAEDHPALGAVKPAPLGFPPHPLCERRRVGLNRAVLVRGNGPPRRLGLAFHLPGVNRQARQLAQQRAALGKADPRRTHPHHAQHRR